MSGVARPLSEHGRSEQGYRGMVARDADVPYVAFGYTIFSMLKWACYVLAVSTN